VPEGKQGVRSTVTTAFRPPASSAPEVANRRAAGGVRSRACAPCCEHKARRAQECGVECGERYSKSGKQVRALIPLQPSTVVEDESCEISDERARPSVRADTCLRARAGIR
jgi:hypothetical protein